MSKKLVNNPDEAVDEALSGLVAANPHLRLLEGHRVVIRADVEDAVKASNKVALICGGGSGHEPAHGGFVGRGMLTAAVAGSVFASPPTSSIVAAIKAVCGPAGTLVLLKNYTGDRLNFGLAVEQARAEGLKVNMVVVGEDCALPSLGKTAGRRGLCGAILVEKIAGALAEQDGTLQEVTTVACQVADSMGTLGVCLSPCSIPGRPPSFTLAADELEFGLGIHGEAGVKRTKMLPSRDVVRWLVRHITNQEEGYGYFKMEKGDRVGVLLNNLGGSSNLEMGVLMNDTVRHLVDDCGVDVVRVVTGALTTSLEMAGISLTIVKLNDAKWVELLDKPTDAVGWPNVKVGMDRVDSGCLPAPQCKDRALTVERRTSTAAGMVLRQCFEKICQMLVENESRLNDLDKASGDGDTGTTLQIGGTALLGCIGSVEWDDQRQALLDVAQVVNGSMGGTSGALYSLFLTRAAGEVGSGGLEEWLKAGHMGLDAVMQYGGASPGDRTLIDAVQPALTALERDVKDQKTALVAVRSALQAAKQGATATVQMTAKSGRASYVSREHLTQPDPGAVAVTVVLEAVEKSLS